MIEVKALNKMSLIHRRTLCYTSQLLHSYPTTRSKVYNRRVLSTTATDDEVVHPAIIMGGGPTGLFLSNLLTSYSIPHLLFDKRPVEELTKHPQAHFINLRSMEILRHELPRVYAEIKEGMPPVSEWEAFHFGASIIGGRRLGRVIHPVAEPLKIGQRGDAVLVSDHNGIRAGKDDEGTSVCDIDRISPCQPGHLAQNKFVSLLLKEASRKNNGEHLHYDAEIVKITNTMSKSNHPTVTIQTPTNTYQTHYLLACDGVHSFARKHCQISMRGDSALQHMMNIHFRTNSSLSSLLMAQKGDQAMLHFVYNPSLVGAFVCHDGHGGEWVLQVPYFPPYQVPEVDFTPDKVKDMIWFGLLGHIPTNSDASGEQYKFDILSVRSWTMSSQVAERYINQSQNVLLVGDAAHAFPPAGGFGMNTGLQDAHNLAWRLALTMRHEKQRAFDTDEASLSNRNSILTNYEHDRMPIASQNAALSVRNYQRTLRIAKACYLDAQHPQLLMNMLGSPPMSFLPLETRQDLFRRLVKVAMMPLGSLLDGQNSFHSSHLERNVRKILENGGSLPLVFPRYELGFIYNQQTHARTNAADDSAGYYPVIREGHRLPHVQMELLELSAKDRWSVLEAPHQTSFHNSDNVKSPWISLVDISSQLRQARSLCSPLFTLLVLGRDLTHSFIVQRACNEMMDRSNIPLALVHVLQDSSEWADIGSNSGDSANEEHGCQIVHLRDVHQALHQIVQRDLSTDRTDADEGLNAAILVRPDGHIACASCIDSSKDMKLQLCALVKNGLSNSLG